ncbi:unnamed protein product [Pleuronectes platessa]|uniref:Kinase suppressor RAS 1 N-terminal helical hairpin domain-containing protein n=1 Tax=Pleuronectes platessa TaxID=8262 RepID=A0A9N7V5A5_PLEPL|nr:unnamed protein product [Pleuronectes platessa]
MTKSEEQHLSLQKALQQCELVQNMIDISISSLEGLRTKCATSNDLTQKEIRTLEIDAGANLSAQCSAINQEEAASTGLQWGWCRLAHSAGGGERRWLFSIRIMCEACRLLLLLLLLSPLLLLLLLPVFTIHQQPAQPSERRIQAAPPLRKGEQITEIGTKCHYPRNWPAGVFSKKKYVTLRNVHRIQV